MRLSLASILLKDFACIWLGSDAVGSERVESNGWRSVLTVHTFIWHGNASTCIPNYISADETAEEERQGRGVRVASSLNRRYGFSLNRHRCLTELGLMASKAEMDQGKHPRPTMARLATKKPRVLAPGSSEDSKHKKVIENLSRERNRNIREVLTGGPYDSKRKLKELIGPPGARILDDVLRNLHFYPSMGSQAFKKYFSPKWEDLAFHGDLEDALEASLAAVVRTIGMQLKVLEELRQWMQRRKKLVAESSKSEEHK
ncbi:hypothetical protein Adt_11896 [Abeliophyllum distichum]|uniref:Uncharacterized protein n=1 Tax=Abeliophyllum distichum TaxID=126358 RepID=A0ABD1UP60_9LAMI